MKTKVLPFAFTIALLIYCSSFLFAQNFQSDLIPLDLKVNPTNGQAGSGASVSFYIYNQGSGIANASTADIRITTSNSNITTSDPLLASINIPSLPVDTTYPVTQSVLIPNNLSPGTYYIWVILDVNNTANQSNLTNDKAYASFTINNVVQQSDLVPQNLTVNPTSGLAGSNASVSFTIYNQGIGIANASTTDIRISTSNSSVTTSDPLLAQINTPSIAAGGSNQVTQSVAIPNNLSPGTYYVWVILDVNNIANQSNLSNDKAYESFTVINSNNTQNSLDNLWVTNSGVESVVVNDATNTIYIGGNFTLVGPPTGGGGVIDAASGTVDTGFPNVNGIIYAVAPDGSGGWYIGGIFTYVGGIARNNIAHIKSDKTLDASWNPDADGFVYAIAVSGSTVYVGGNFTNIGGHTRYSIAALDASTGLLTAWDPNGNGGIVNAGVVNALSVSDSTVYVGGNFTRIGGQPRNNIAALDASTGNPKPWNPDANFGVTALVVSGSRLYVGGLFTSIGGQIRNNIAALDTTTGTATSWNPNASSSVYAIAISGSTIYAGGHFTNIGGQTRYYIAALDTSTGLATQWNPNTKEVIGLNDVQSIAVSGSVVYAGGLFSNIGGQNRNFLAGLDTSTGSATSWNPNANYNVDVLAVSGSAIYAGGEFTSIGDSARSYIAALDATTGAATSWNPGANGSITALAVSGSTIYAGGEFTNIGGQSRNGIAALNASNGFATSWNPNANSTVTTLAVSDSTVYAGGSFTNIGGQTRNYIAAIDATTGNPTLWNPDANNGVTALVVSGSTVYTCGVFTSIGGQTRNYIAALDASSGLATSWNPDVNSDVTALAVSGSGSTVYAGGSFTSIGDSARNYIAALDATSGAATSWNPNAKGGWVNALAVSGSVVYAGGAFAGINSIGGQMRNGIAALDATTGAATSWNPNPDNSVNSIALSFSNATVYFGGSFTRVSNYMSSNLARMTDLFTSVVKSKFIFPKEYSLSQNYPNPFNPSTIINYQLPISSKVILRVYDLLGRKVATLVNKEQNAGNYNVKFNAGNLASGVYFYRLSVGGFSQVKKLVLLK